MNYIKHLESKIYKYSLKYHFEDPSYSGIKNFKKISIIK